MPEGIETLNPWLRALRLERWPRSTAIGVGIAALVFLDRDRVAAAGPAAIALRTLGAFLLTWAVSTANYVVNEIVDAPFDVHHPTKRNRPLAAGEVRKGPLAAIGLALAAGSLAAGWALFSRPFFFALLALLAAGVVYNVKPLRTKDVPFLDSVSESANNPIRFAIGWYAFAPASFPPLEILVSWWAFGNFLMVAKRLSELRFLKEKAGDYRASLRRYSKASLLFGMAFSAAVFFAAYLAFAGVYRLQGFFYLAPFVAVYFALFFYNTLAEKEVMEEPERLFRRPAFALYTALLAVLFALVFILDRVGE